MLYKAYSDMYSTLDVMTENSVRTKKVIMSCTNEEQLKSAWNMALGYEKLGKNTIREFVGRNRLANILSFGSLKKFLEKRLERKMETILDHYKLKFERLELKNS